LALGRVLFSKSWWGYKCFSTLEGHTHRFLGGIDNDLQIFVVKTPMRNFSSFATFIFFVTQHMVSSIVQLSLVGENAFTNNILSWQNFRNSSKLLIFIIQQSGFVH
jgi:hypothetical protein